MTLEIGPARAAERDDVADITRATGVFAGDELTTPSELLEEYLTDPDDPAGYHFLSARLRSKVVGFACYGRSDFTVGTYDLFWIAVHPDHQGSGVGRALFEHLAADLRARGARLMIVWTSGRDAFARARAFYVSMGCRFEARIQDFYDAGDDLCVYSYRIE